MDICLSSFLVHRISDTVYTVGLRNRSLASVLSARQVFQFPTVLFAGVFRLAAFGTFCACGVSFRGVVSQICIWVVVKIRVPFGVP